MVGPRQLAMRARWRPRASSPAGAVGRILTATILSVAFSLHGLPPASPAGAITDEPLVPLGALSGEASAAADHWRDSAPLATPLDGPSCPDHFDRVTTDGLGLGPAGQWHIAPTGEVHTPGNTYADGESAVRRLDVDGPETWDYIDMPWELTPTANEVTFSLEGVNLPFAAVGGPSSIEGWMAFAFNAPTTILLPSGVKLWFRFHQGWAGSSQYPDPNRLYISPELTSQTGQYPGYDDEWGYTEGLLDGPLTLRIRVTDHSIQVRAWPEGQPEPLEWTAFVSISEPIATTQLPRYFMWQFWNTGSDDAPGGKFLIDRFDPCGAVSEPTMMFIHGWQGNSADLGDGFESLIDEVETRHGADRVVRFDHFQDARFRQGEQCIEPRPLVLPSEPSGGMPVDMAGSDPNEYCDSNGDMALNAVALHEDVSGLYEQTGEKVLLVANSMGAAIVRGFLSYSEELEDGVAANSIDGVVFLEGAHDGSWAAEALVASLDAGAFIGELVPVWPLAGLEPARPAARDLIDQSPWYTWANPGGTRLPDLPYYNAFGDLDIVIRSCWLFFDCQEAKRDPWGDTVMLTGTDDPFDVPAGGGARFLRIAADTPQWQWRLQGEVVIDDPISHATAGIPELYFHPISHAQFGDHMVDIASTFCQTGTPTNMRVALMDLISARMDGDSVACQS